MSRTARTFTDPLRPRSPQDRLIFALDVEHGDEAERLVKLLAPHVGMFKIGSRVFTGVGSSVIDLVHSMGSGVFVDLKFHDIPETVAGAAREVARHRARMFTVHALGGANMIRRAVRELSSMTLIPGIAPPLCLAVTLLTSHSDAELSELGLTGPIVDHVKRLALLAMTHGASGVVASGLELPALRAVLPSHTVYVTPGIRAQSGPVGDQSRVVTAKEAIEAGATYVVVGRPIRDAASPVDAAKRFVDEIAGARLP